MLHRIESRCPPWHLMPSRGDSHSTVTAHGSSSRPRGPAPKPTDSDMAEERLPHTPRASSARLLVLLGRYTSLLVRDQV